MVGSEQGMARSGLEARPLLLLQTQSPVPSAGAPDFASGSGAFAI